jgi:hypothetical protein
MGHPLLLDLLFHRRHSGVMKKTKENSILWVEATGFSLLIGLTILCEAVRIPHLVFGEDFAPNWRRALLRSAVLVLVWIWVHRVTRRLLKRLHYLEDFLRICCGCRRVCHRDEWLLLEDYFSFRFATATTHGLCPSCYQKKMAELPPLKHPPAVKVDPEGIKLDLR